MPAPLLGRAVSALHSNLVFGRRVRAIASHVAALIPYDARTVLDIGCGDGTLAAELIRRRPDLTVLGLETRARPTCAIPMRTYDGARIPYDDQSWDIALLIDVLHHASDPLTVLREAARVVKRAVVLKDHFADPWMGRARLRFMDWAGNVAHDVPLRNSYLTRAQWDVSFGEAGLTVVERVERLGLYPWPVRWLIESKLHFASRLAPDRRSS